MSNIFDTYSLNARLRPALFVLLPLFVTVAVWMPSLYEVAAALVSIAVACGLTILLAHIARSLGRSHQTKLVEVWGALPTTLWLRHSNNNLDEHTRGRYFRFLEKSIPNWRAPTKEQEEASPESADAMYNSAVKWLLEYARDKKSLILFSRKMFLTVFEETCPA